MDESSVLARFRPYLPHHLYAHLMKSEEEIPSERRTATVIFADLSGFTTMSEKMDPEKVAELTSEALEALGRPVLALDGTIDKYIGDALMAIFGAPLSHADDPRRALDAALAMRRAIRGLGRRGLSVSIGVHSGLVVAGNIGGRARREYSVLGDTVNVASRVEGIAGRGEILVSDDARRQAGPAFAYGRPRSVRLKGRVDPVTVRPLIGKRAMRDATRWRIAPVFIGRAGIIERIEEGMTRDAAQILVGIAGSGKSTLVKRLATRNAKRRTIFRVAVKYGAAMAPLQLVRDIVEAAGGTSGADRGRERSFAALTADARVDPDEVRSALHGLFATRKGGVLIIEDIHLADEASLLALNRSGPIPGLSVIATARPTAGSSAALAHAEIVELPLFDRANSFEMIRRLLRARSIPETCALIAEQTGGVPLAIEELTRFLVEQGMLYKAPSGRWRLWSEVAGDTALFTVIRSRLDALSPHARSLVSRVAVFGIACPWRDDRDPLSDRPVADALAEAERGGILRREGSEVAFLHDHYRHVAYHSQLFRIRRDLHNRAASWFIAEKQGPEAAADHLLKAEEMSSAVPYLRLAAERAANSHAHVTACRYFESIREIARRQRDPRVEAEALLGLANSRLKLSQFAPTGAAIRSAAAIIRRKKLLDLDLARMAQEANLCKNIGRIDRMKTLCREVIKKAPSSQVGVRAAALQTLGAQQWRDGDYRGAVGTYERILGMAVSAGAKRMAAGSLIDLYRMTGEYRKAERLFPRALTDTAAGWPLLHIGRIRLVQGRLDDAERLFKEAAGWAVKNRDARLETLAYRELARWACEFGDRDRAIAFMEKGILKARSLPAFRARAHAEAAVLFAKLGNYSRARAESVIAEKLNRRLPLVETSAVLMEAEALILKGLGDGGGSERVTKRLRALRLRQGALAEVIVLAAKKMLKAR